MSVRGDTNPTRTRFDDYDQHFQTIDRALIDIDEQRTAARLDLQTKAAAAQHSMNIIRNDVRHNYTILRTLRYWIIFLGLLGLIDGLSTALVWIVLGRNH